MVYFQNHKSNKKIVTVVSLLNSFLTLVIFKFINFPCEHRRLKDIRGVSN